MTFKISELDDRPEEIRALVRCAYEQGYADGENSVTADWMFIADEYGLDELIRRVKHRIDWQPDTEDDQS